MYHMEEGHILQQLVMHQWDKQDFLSIHFITTILLEAVVLDLRITRFQIQICDMHLPLQVQEGTGHVIQTQKPAILEYMGTLNNM